MTNIDLMNLPLEILVFEGSGQWRWLIMKEPGAVSGSHEVCILGVKVGILINSLRVHVRCVSDSPKDLEDQARRIESCRSSTTPQQDVGGYGCQGTVGNACAASESMWKRNV